MRELNLSEVKEVSGGFIFGRFATMISNAFGRSSTLSGAAVGATGNASYYYANSSNPNLKGFAGSAATGAAGGMVGAKAPNIIKGAATGGVITGHLDKNTKSNLKINGIHIGVD